MTLAEAIEQLAMLAADTYICVRRPWSADAECVLTPPDDELSIPSHVTDAGFEYFLEVFTAREVLEVFGDRVPSHDEKVRVLLHYAEYDAYPDWVYG